MPFNNRSRSPPCPSHYFTMLGYIFGLSCQTTSQVQEKLISRLPVEIYVQLRCYCCVLILGNIVPC